MQVEEGRGLFQEVLWVCPQVIPSQWVRVWTYLRAEEPHYSAQEEEEEEDGKCELTGRGGGWRQKEGVGAGQGPYLDLLGMEGQDETKEQEGGDADGAFNQEQVERPLLGEREKGVRSHQSLPISLLYLPPKQPFLLNSHFPRLLSPQATTQCLPTSQFWEGSEPSSGRHPFQLDSPGREPPPQLFSQDPHPSGGNLKFTFLF